MRLSHFFAASAALLLLSVNAEAQFTNSRHSRSSSRTSSSVSVSNGWNQLTLQYKPDCIDVPDLDDDDPNFNAVSIEYGRAISVAAIPLYLMPVIGLQWTFWSESDDYDEYDVKLSINMLSIRPGANLGYLVELGGISLFPYFGITTRLSPWGEIKATASYEEETETDSADIFNNDDSDFNWNRFQIGWVTGIEAQLGAFVFGLSYGSDYNYFQKDNTDYIKAQGKEFSLKVGLMF